MLCRVINEISHLLIFFYTYDRGATHLYCLVLITWLCNGACPQVQEILQQASISRYMYRYYISMCQIIYAFIIYLWAWQNFADNFGVAIVYSHFQAWKSVGGEIAGEANAIQSCMMSPFIEGTVCVASPGLKLFLYVVPIIRFLVYISLYKIHRPEFCLLRS